MNKNLSRLAADLYKRSKGGEELSSKIDRLRDEINKVMEGEDTIFGKFRELVESFQEIIPEEKQRFNAAIKALSTTSKLSRQEIVKAVNNQLEELKILEKGLMPALPGWRDELRSMEVKAQEMRSEVSKLRERITLLEIEEKVLVNGMASREKEMELVQKAMKDLFAEIGAEIADIKQRVEEVTAESRPAQPAPKSAPLTSDDFLEEKAGGGQKDQGSKASETQDTEWQKKCPMCGGRIHLHIYENMWQCYSCAYEESAQDKVEGKIEEIGESKEKSDQMNSMKTVPGADSLFDPLLAQDEPLQSDDIQKSKKKSAIANIQSSIKKKTCPNCRKKMQWFEEEKTWRCPFCEYERSI